MKIYSKVTLDLTTLSVIDEESEEYSGPIAKCKGGGGASGKVDWPSYIKDTHYDWLSNSGLTVNNVNVNQLLNIAMANGSPWANAETPDQTSNITDMNIAVDDLDTLVDALMENSTLDEVMTNALSQSRINNSVSALSTLLQDDLDSLVIPEFEAGMRDVNAVLSSAFVIGKAILQDGKDKKVAQYAADLAMKIETDMALKAVGLKLEYGRVASAMAIEVSRLKYSIESEVYHQDLEYAAADSKWGLSLFEQAGNILAAPSGAATTRKSDPNKVASSVGGALSGAVAGGMLAGAEAGGLSGPQGAALGAVVGGVAGYLMA